MISVLFVDPTKLPARIPGIALHRPGNIVFLLREGLTPGQVAHWITHLGTRMTREAVDATVDRGKTTPKP
jgi:hypothetical protein